MSSPLDAPVLPTAPAAPVRSPVLGPVVRGVLRSPQTLLGLTLVVVHVVLALLAPLVAPFDPVTNDATSILLGPGDGHLLGTDQLGRDILSRVLYGGRYSLPLAVVAAVVTVGIGTVLGCLAACHRGAFDEILMRIVDAVLSVPSILALLVVVSMFGAGGPVIVLAAVVIYSPAVVRVLRAAALQVVPLDYVTAARARGEGTFAVIRREILPNVVDVVFVELAMRASFVLLLVSSLSFLGFGANPPTPDWGLMVSENRTLLAVLPWGTVGPIVALATLIIGFNLTADGLAKIRGVDRTLVGV
ncbi:ABC transporter permease [Kineococcus gynurae]|uniref:ABC transporter permease n=1 Tax=Kineococcus gynurae TaxID=452979 RepID=A0ABV5LVF7_9ACTN